MADVLASDGLTSDRLHADGGPVRVLTPPGRPKAWARARRGARMPGRDDLASAIRQAFTRRPFFRRCLEDGRVAMVDGATEGGIVLVVIGRESWLLAGAEAGGGTLAFAMISIGSAKPGGHDPQAATLARLPDHKNSRLDEALPCTWTSAALTAQAATCSGCPSGRSRLSGQAPAPPEGVLSFALASVLSFMAGQENHAQSGTQLPRASNGPARRVAGCMCFCVRRATP